MRVANNENMESINLSEVNDVCNKNNSLNN